MIDTVVITGEMRSGTSLVAQILHRLGFFAGVYITCPIPPRWRSDWEDSYAPGLIENPKKISPAYFFEWKRSKRLTSHAMGFDGKIQMKSPYLALHWQKLKKVLPYAFTIKTRRDPAEIDASMAAHPYLNAEDQCEIAKCLGSIKEDYLFDTDRCQEAPQGVIQELCKALHVSEDLSAEASFMVERKELI